LVLEHLMECFVLLALDEEMNGHFIDAWFTWNLIVGQGSHEFEYDLHPVGCISSLTNQMIYICDYFVFYIGYTINIVVI
jgi:hypothetical protein